MSLHPFEFTEKDAVLLRDFSASYPLASASPWPPRPDIPVTPRPITISARLFTSEGFATGAALDSLDAGDTISYADVAQAFAAHLAWRESLVAAGAAVKHQAPYLSAEQLAEGLAQVALWECGAVSVDLLVSCPGSLLQGRSSGVSLTRSREDYLAIPAPIHLRSLASPPLRSADDKLLIEGLRVSCIIGIFDFEREREQDVVVDVIGWPTRQAGQSWLEATQASEEDMGVGIRRLASAIQNHVKASSFLTLEALASSAASHALNLRASTPIGGDSISSDYALRQVTVKIEKLSAVALCQGPGVSVTRRRGSCRPSAGPATNGHDRLAQPLADPAASVLHSEASSFDLARVPVVATSGVQNLLDRSLTPIGFRGYSTLPPSHVHLQQRPPGSTSSSRNKGYHDAYIGLGSNLGDRMGNLVAAVTELSRPAGDGGLLGAEVRDVSFAWESAAMYYEAQPSFINAACRIRTRLEPLDLLDALKAIESRLGRDVTRSDKGPRPIDLDILLYDDCVVDTPRLTIPHIGISEREFVLRPLCDVAPHVQIPRLERSATSLLAEVLAKSVTGQVCRRVCLVPCVRLPENFSCPGEVDVCAPSLDLSTRTHIMSIVNCTPDSFSDGGDAYDTEAAVAACLQHLENGADILDIGGMSTRPGADDVDPSEEIARTVPVIAALRGEHGVTAHISIDTFRAEVALAAVNAGATIINDVTGGQGDVEMLPTMAELDVPVCLMHMRGNPRTMQSSELKRYEGEDVVAGVRKELSMRVSEALAAGVKRWNILLDPGIGFAKSSDHNLTLLRDLPLLVRSPAASDSTYVAPESLEGYPLLVGPSRKAFLGKICAKGGKPAEPKDRVFATAATVAASVQGGARIVRVHDTAAMKDVCSVADAIFRRPAKVLAEATTNGS